MEPVAIVPNATSTIDCWCSVHQSGAEDIFLVEISRTETIATLTKAIKEKNPAALLPGVDADTLTLYQTSAFDDDADALKQHLDDWTPDEKSFLHPQTRLSALDLSDSLVVVVEPTQHLILVLRCWVHGHPVNRVFEVRISSAKTVLDLIDAVKKEKPIALFDILADDVTLCRTPITDERVLERRLNNWTPFRGEESTLNPRARLSTLNLSNSFIVVDAPRLRTLPRILSPSTYSPGPSQQSTVVLNCWIRGHDANRIFQVEISSEKHVAQLQEAIKKKKPEIFSNVDAGYLNLYKLKHPVSVPYKENLNTLILSQHAQVMSWMYTLSEAIPEQLPENDIHVIVDAPSSAILCYLRGARLNEHFPISFQLGEKTDELVLRIKEARPDLRSVDCHIRLYGVSGNDDELGKSLRETGAGNLLLPGPVVDNFQCLPVLEPLRVVVEVYSADSPPVDQIAYKRAEWIAAYDAERPPEKRRAEWLAEYESKNPPHYPTRFVSLLGKGEQVDFQYTSQPFKHKLLFYGVIPSERREVCIKLVRRYSKEVHELCASWGRAPVLLGFETLSPDWFMVVMNKLDLDKYSAIRIKKRMRMPTDCQMVDIRNTLRNLHRLGWVHGDVQDTNILLSITDLRVSFIFLGFNWAGEIGKVRYPPNVNKGEDLWRPENVVGGNLISPNDDLAMWNDIEDRLRKRFERLDLSFGSTLEL